MRLDLGDLVRALTGRIFCVDECSNECTICVELPDDELRNLDSDRKLYVALYAAARRILDYRLVAAMHIHFVKSRAVVDPKLLVKALENAKFWSVVPPAIDDNSPYAWEAVKWRGIVYAEMVLGSEKRRVQSGVNIKDACLTY